MRGITVRGEFRYRLSASEVVTELPRPNLNPETKAQVKAVRTVRLRFYKEPIQTYDSGITMTLTTLNTLSKVKGNCNALWPKA